METLPAGLADFATFAKVAVVVGTPAANPGCWVWETPDTCKASLRYSIVMKTANAVNAIIAKAVNTD